MAYEKITLENLKLVGTPRWCKDNKWVEDNRFSCIEKVYLDRIKNTITLDDDTFEVADIDDYDKYIVVKFWVPENNGRSYHSALLNFVL